MTKLQQLHSHCILAAGLSPTPEEVVEGWVSWEDRGGAVASITINLLQSSSLPCLHKEETAYATHVHAFSILQSSWVIWI